MNLGIANCTLLLQTNKGDWNSAVTHEVGHTLGWRHSDQTRSGGIPCIDPPLECSGSAIMTATVTSGLNAALQTWDVHAASLVYPAGAAPSAVASVEAHATTTTNVQVSWSGSCSTTCHVYRSADLLTYTQVGSGTSPFNDTVPSTTTSYMYKVRAFNGTTESIDSNTDLATNMIFANDPIVAGSTTIQALHLTQIRTAIDAVRKLANNGVANPFNYVTDPTITQNVTLIRAIHITDARTALDQAAPAVGLPTGGYTNAVAMNVPIRAIDFQELRNRVK